METDWTEEKKEFLGLLADEMIENIAKHDCICLGFWPRIQNKNNVKLAHINISLENGFLTFNIENDDIDADEYAGVLHSDYLTGKREKISKDIDRKLLISGFQELFDKFNKLILCKGCGSLHGNYFKEYCKSCYSNLFITKSKELYECCICKEMKGKKLFKDNFCSNEHKDKLCHKCRYGLEKCPLCRKSFDPNDDDE